MGHDDYLLYLNRIMDMKEVDEKLDEIVLKVDLEDYKKEHPILGFFKENYYKLTKKK